MILIISSKEDSSTNEVIDWLRHFKAKFVRISSDNKLRVKEIIIDSQKIDGRILIDGKIFWLSDFKSIWYRRSFISIESFKFTSTIDTEFENDVNHQLSSEIFYLTKIILC